MTFVKSLFCYALALLFLCASCTEQFYPRIDSNTSILVVDGKITNETGPYEVRLFRTVNFDKNYDLQPERSAMITLYDDIGNIAILQEVEAGIYRTTDNTILGEIGRTYWIEIETQTGEMYESIPEKMPSTIDIESIYGEEEDITINTSEKKKGAKFYFDAKGVDENANYMRWEYKESYEWRSPEILNNEQITENPSKICYPVRIFPQVNTYDASNLNPKIISRLETSVILNNEVKLQYNYLIDITLHSISQHSFAFWEQIRATNQANGVLYDILPANIDGNINNCPDDCQAIGYFEVSSVSRKQRFFNEENFSLKFANYPEECETFEMRMEDDSPNPTKFHVLSSRRDGRATIYVVRRNECYECNVIYPPNKPSFWP